MKIKTLILTLVLIVFSVGMGIFLLRSLQPSPEKNNIARSTLPTPKPKLKNGIIVHLQPESITTTVDSLVILSVNLDMSKIKNPLQAIDVLLQYDPELLEFVSSISSDSGYINPRKLAKNGRLVTSFIRLPTKVESKDIVTTLNLGTLTFKALKPGVAEIKPILKTKVPTSEAYLKQTKGNQIEEMFGAEVKIQ